MSGRLFFFKHGGVSPNPFRGWYVNNVVDIGGRDTDFKKAPGPKICSLGERAWSESIRADTQRTNAVCLIDDMPSQRFRSQEPNGKTLTSLCAHALQRLLGTTWSHLACQRGMVRKYSHGEKAVPLPRAQRFRRLIETLPSCTCVALSFRHNTVSTG